MPKDFYDRQMEAAKMLGITTAQAIAIYDRAFKEFIAETGRIKKKNGKR